MKKFLTLVTAMLLAVTCCFGLACGGDSDPNIAANINYGIDASYVGEVNVRILNKNSEKAMMNTLVEGFNVEYPYITVNVSTVDEGQYYNNLLLDVNAGNMDDVFWIAQDKIDTVVKQKKVLYPLEEILNTDTAFSIDSVVDEAIACSSLKVDGQLKLCMIPRDYNEVVMYYNTALFDAAGVDYPDPAEPMTQAQFTQMVTDLRAGLDEAATPHVVDVNACWDSFSWPLLKSFGATVVDSTGAVTFDNAKTKEALEYWRSLYADPSTGVKIGVLPNSSTTSSGNEFRMNQAAIYFHARAALTDICTPINNVGIGNGTLGVAPIPNFGGTYAVGGGSSGYAMYKGAKDVSAAWAFLKYVVSADGQQALSASGNHIPSLESELNNATATWRTYTNAKINTDHFDSDTFLVGKEEGAYTTTRDFFDYMPVGIQFDVLDCISKCFQEINMPDYTPTKLAAKITEQAGAIDVLINRAR